MIAMNEYPEDSGRDYSMMACISKEGQPYGAINGIQPAQ
jgi:hypothetical protein